MAPKVQALRGMEDILPSEVDNWQWMEERARIFFEARGYREIRTPLLEMSDLFIRSVGEASDIIHKEMFRFEDRGGRDIALRPEMTASVARAVLEHGLLTQAKSLRLYYLGPMLRAERPQAGRKRQFHQIGIELIAVPAREGDFECIGLLHSFLRHLGLSDYSFRVNNLGDPDQQRETVKALKGYFSEQVSKLCEDCRWRLEKNVLRIFDCKVESCQPVIRKAPWEKAAPLGEDFQKLTGELTAHHIPFTVERRLVRGLDYYNGTVFEVAASGLGAQDALAGGGRYDRLYSDLGGAKATCAGFSIGSERLLTLLKKQGEAFEKKVRSRRVYLAPLAAGCELLGFCHEAALRFREQGIRVESTIGETSLTKHLQKANGLGIRLVVIVGEDEWKAGRLALKDMEKKEQSAWELEPLLRHLAEVFAS